MALVDEIEELLRKHPLISCGCCADYSEYDNGARPDGCPVDPDDPGYVDHDFGAQNPNCVHEKGRVRVLAEDISALLELR